MRFVPNLRRTASQAAEAVGLRPRFAFHHRSESINIGDRVCGPYRWFDFPNHRITPQRKHARAPHVLIYGGGFILPEVKRQLADGRARADHRVAWGLGTAGSPADRDVFDSFTLIGLREYEPGSAEFYVPCVTCMSPLFDTVPEPDCDLVFYAHAEKSASVARLPDIPERDNHTGTLDAALRFIARGETVVTNSYHGTHWALLMGRRVLCLPFNSKFRRFRHPPGYAEAETWPDHLTTARRAPEDFLSECRERNTDFYHRVMAL